MPRLKTHSATKKRFKLTGGKKRHFMSRRATQGHFNAREDGETVRNKRREVVVDKTNVKRLKVLMPYHATN